MNKVLLKKIVLEEIHNVFEQMATDRENTKQALKKMADRLGMRVYVSMGSAYNSIEFYQKQDVDEKTFEMFIKLIEKLGYNVDLGKSDRTYEKEFGGERDYYPRIIF